MRKLNTRWYKVRRILTNPRRFSGTVWALSKKTRFPDFARSINPELLKEAQDFRRNFQPEKFKIIAGLPISGGQPGASAGGGGNEDLLYFLIRLLRPKTVLETGVSAGASTRAILEAMEKNGHGTLYSSDLALHLQREQVGILVPERLRHRWNLFQEGDAENLPVILSKCQNFDFVYYDSEKTPEAKNRFVQTTARATKDAVMAFDDIDRDSFFRKWSRGKDARVVGFVGLANLTPNDWSELHAQNAQRAA